MRRFFPLGLVLGACLMIPAPASRAAAAEKPAADDAKDWVQLFNGKDLTGWEVYPDGTGPWKVEEGILVGTGNKGSHLFTKRNDYQNFVYRVEVMISDKGNSGQYFRTKFGPGYPKGYEAQINSTHPDPQKTGSLYNFSPYKKILVEPNTWFTQEVTAEGNHIIIKVNGTTTADYVDKKNTYTKGRFALQLHDPTKGVNTTVKFRKIEVKELPATATEEKTDK